MNSRRMKISIAPLLLLLFLTLCVAQLAFADLVEDFKMLDGIRKGPFTVNYLQGTKGRVGIDGSSPSGRFLFQAAYRNDHARKIAADYDVYLANLFTTNYYELMGEYVYENPYGSHDVDHDALIAKANEAMPKAISMTKNWLLEKYYISRHHNSKLAESFQLRGIGGSEFEQEYATHYFNFYLSGLAQTDEMNYLPGYLLLKESPVNKSNQLDKARQLISTSYDSFVERWGKNDRRVKDLYELRNAIHNQISRAVIAQIDAYVAKHEFYKKEGHTYLFKIQDILREYYDFKVEKIAKLAKTLGLGNIEALATMAESNDPVILNELSFAVAQLRSEIATTTAVPQNKKAEALLLISYTAQYLAKEINQASALDNNLLQALINVIYMEGFLIQDNWTYFLDEAKGGTSSSEVLENVVLIAQDTIQTVFGEKYEAWSSVSPDGMKNFKDDMIKSSSLTVASIWQQKL